ncbi:kinase-like domain-containing protein [Mycena olivaceomarginata]|nr:kinase-like domain-containing protein [Mycena olivaceomarginata]
MNNERLYPHKPPHRIVRNFTDLRAMLTACEERISASLIAVLHSRDAKRAALLLEGARAQSFLDAVQDVLDRGALNAAYASQAWRLIIRLSEAREQLPSSLFITGVSDHDECPTFSGGFGDVYRASFNGDTVALKRIRKFHASADAPRSRLQVCREALIWQKLRHKNILPLIGIDREMFPSFSMVSPWMKHGNVLRYLSTHGRRDVENMLLQIAEGLAYLHSVDIVHGDLRGTNILVADDWSIRLTDFGLASAVGGRRRHHIHRTRILGQPRGQPAVLFECDRVVRTPESDVYAFACVCVELHTGKPPFSGVSPDVAAMLKVVAGETPAATRDHV